MFLYNTHEQQSTIKKINLTYTLTRELQIHTTHNISVFNVLSISTFLRSPILKAQQRTLKKMRTFVKKLIQYEEHVAKQDTTCDLCYTTNRINRKTTKALVHMKT